MICKCYRILFWVIPIKKWQSYLIESHFSTCARCKQAITGDKGVDPLVISPQQAAASASLWPGVRKGILSQHQTTASLKKPLCRFLPRWQWAAAVVVLAAVLLVIPFVIANKTTDDVPGNQVDRPGRSISVRSARLEGEPAHSYVFNSRDPEMTMIWVEKNKKGEYQ